MTTLAAVNKKFSLPKYGEVSRIKIDALSARKYIPNQII
jgi:hypothetical protein